MFSVRARIVAFTPLVVLTLLTTAAAVVGIRSGDTSPGPTLRAEPTRSVPTTGSADPTPFTPIPSVVPVLSPGTKVTITQARQSWDHAIDKLVNAASGKYSWAVYFGADPDPFQSESGGFDLDPFQSSFDRTITYEGKKHLVHVRRIDQTTYMQFDHWGSWSGCWLRVTNELIEQQTGVDLSDSLPLPVAVLAITDATITKPTGFWFGSPYREYRAEVNAAEALAFFGFSGVVINKQLTRLAAIEVPITISLDAEGRLHGGGARGTEVAAAISRVAPNLLRRAVQELPQMRAAFAVKGLGSPVSVPAPLPGSILPFNAGRNDTCAARGPRA